MEKKTFKNNPALAFISAAQEAPEAERETPSAADPAASAVPMKKNPLYIETKSKRVQLLMQPSLHAKVKVAAAKKGISINELISEVLEQAVN